MKKNLNEPENNLGIIRVNQADERRIKWGIVQIDN